MATAQAAVVVVVAAGSSGAGVAAGSGVVAASSRAGPPSPRSSDLLHAHWFGWPPYIHPAPTNRKHPKNLSLEMPKHGFSEGRYSASIVEHSRLILCKLHLVY